MTEEILSASEHIGDDRAAVWITKHKWSDPTTWGTLILVDWD